MLIVNQNNKDIILWVLNVTHTGGRAYADQTELIFLVGQTSCVPPDMPQTISTAEFQRTSLLKRCDTSLKKKKGLRSSKEHGLCYITCCDTRTCQYFRYISSPLPILRRGLQKKTLVGLESWWTTSLGKVIPSLILTDSRFYTADGSQTFPQMKRFQGASLCFPDMLFQS